MIAIHPRRFIDGYRRTFGPLTHEQDEGLRDLMRAIEHDEAVNEDDICPIAYMLATVKHECADTWRPIVERGPRSYFDQYEPGTDKGRRLGNTEPGDGYRYRGRGYVQITGRANYARMRDVLRGAWDVNLLDHPEHACLPSIAYAILSIGMRSGLFTGKKLDDYCIGRHSDYVGARRIINGTDQAHMIAESAVLFETLLLAATADDPYEDEQAAVPTPIPTQIPTPPIFVPPPPKRTPPVRGFWQRLWNH